MTKTKIQYRVEIPFRSCCWVDVERDEEMSKDELIDSITRDELCELRVFGDGEHTLDEVVDTCMGRTLSMEIKHIHELDENGGEKQND
jgi:hypothetical protein